jgi:WD40 repeat protein
MAQHEQAHDAQVRPETGVQNPGLKYWAFISYSHTDETWGKWLHEALERYRVPRALVGRDTPRGRIPRRLFPVFRDRDELPGDPNLSNKIAESLAASRFLIVVCSPHSSASEYVDSEIKSFKRLGRNDRVFCLIVSGEPGASRRPGAGLPEAFPAAVRYEIGEDGALTDRQIEPVAADVRDGKDGKTNAKLKLLAGMLGVGYDELKQREKHRQRWRNVQLAIATMLIVGVVAGIWWNRQLAIAERETKAAALFDADLSLTMTDKDAGKRLMLALQSVHRTLDRYEYVLPESEIALYRALTETSLRDTFVDDDQTAAFGGWTWPVNVSNDGSRTLVAAALGPAVLLGQQMEKVAVLMDTEMPNRDDLTALLSHDGKHLVTGGRDGFVRIWTMDGQLQTRFRAHAADIIALGQSASGDVLLSVGCDQGPASQFCELRSARSWTLSGAPVASFQPGEAGVIAASFSPDDSKVVTVGDSGTLHVWLASGTLVTVLSGPTYWIDQSKFTRDGTRFVAGDCPPYGIAGMFSPLAPRACPPEPEEKAQVVVYDEKGMLQQTLPGWFASIDPTGKTIITRTVECAQASPCRYGVHLWKAADGSPIGSFSADAPIADIAFSPDGGYVAIAQEDGRISLRDFEGRVVSSFGGFVPGLTSIRFSGNGDRLISVSCSNAHQGACLERTLQLWDPNGALLKSQQVIGSGETTHSTQINTQPPMIRFSASGMQAFVAAGTESPRVWDSRTGAVVPLADVAGVVQDVAFNADDTRLVTVGQSLQLWDLNGGRLKTETNPLRDEPSGAPFAASSERIAVGNRDGTVSVWNWNRDLERDINGPGTDVLIDVTLAKDAFAVIDTEGRGLIGDMRTGRATEFAAGLVNLNPNGGSWDDSLRFDTGYKLRFTANAERLVVAGPRSVSLWDSQGHMLWAADIDRVDYTAPDVSSSGILIAQCTERGRGASLGSLRTCYDSKATLWGFDGRVIRTLEPRVAGEVVLRRAAFNPQGNRIVTLSEDGSVRLWDGAGYLIDQLFGEADAVDFDPKGARLATLTEHGRVQLWQVWDDLPAMLAEATDRARRAGPVAHDPAR